MERVVELERLAGIADPAEGLTAAEVAAQRADYGDNVIVPVRRHAWLVILGDTLRDPMLWFLFVTAGLYLWLGDLREAVVLLIAVFPLLAMDFFLHWRTSASVSGLQSRLATEARVRRDGAWETVPSHELVVGDLVRVAGGDWIPADGIVEDGAQLQVEESSLTGESWPARKSAWPYLWARESMGGPDESNWVYAGTRLLTGELTYRVLRIGAETAYGGIVRTTQASSHELTPLQQGIARVVKVLLGFALFFCVLIALIRFWQGHGLVDALLSALTFAIAALPEEFPVVFTFFLGVGVFRLAKHRALVRRAVTVENIRHVSCICSDKTGTLTSGELHLTHIVPAVHGQSDRLLETARAASGAERFDPLDRAILSVEPNNHGAPPPAVKRFPFTEDRRRESVVLDSANGVFKLASKGAVETILAVCGIDGAARDEWQARADRYAAEGHKVIAVAELDGLATPEEPAAGMQFLGLLAFEDPPREGVHEAVDACRSLGIRTIMVTGDHPVTARSVARSLGLGQDEPRVLTGDELESGLHQNHWAEIQTVDVVARAKPSTKMALVSALREAGEVVAVTGDGVNDVPALQAADVGIAMGARGTRSAREIADIVLMDDNFRSIVEAIHEGQRMFDNLRLSFLYLLLVHIPLVLTAAIIPLLGYPLLYLPVHIVWFEGALFRTARDDDDRRFDRRVYAVYAADLPAQPGQRRSDPACPCPCPGDAAAGQCGDYRRPEPAQESPGHPHHPDDRDLDDRVDPDSVAGELVDRHAVATGRLGRFVRGRGGARAGQLSAGRKRVFSARRGSRRKTRSGR
ncbi:MAG: HAD-IC family P-type ATPase [Gammaproteobacteria bacterium]